MSLADELLADLETPDQDDFNEESNKESYDHEMDDIEEVDEIDENINENGTINTLNFTGTVHEVARLNNSTQLKKVLKEIERYKNLGTRKIPMGPIEADPEYLLIVEANNLTNEIDNEIDVIHKYTRDHYGVRFPELDSLVSVPLDYLRTVKELGNNIENSKNSSVLPQFLQSAAIMILCVTASTTQGVRLSDEELHRVLEAAEMAIELDRAKNIIIGYIESRMSSIAPNLSHIIGAPVAAKLMGVAGGLIKLCQMPSCNLLVLGTQKKTLGGFSTTSILPHTGFVYYSEIVQEQPPDIRKKLARLVACKSTLAARVDAFHSSPNGESGQELKEEIQNKIDKWLEPPPVKFRKPLPAPIEKPSKHRGGRRARKLKERLGITEIRKQANRMNFAEIEGDAYQSDLGFSMGTLGKAKSGRVRAATVDSKTKARISKTLQQKLGKQTSYGGNTTVRKQVSGTASSVAFTPLQGLEIMTPLAADQKITEGSEKYFSSTSGFSSVKPKMV